MVWIEERHHDELKRVTHKWLSTPEALKLSPKEKVLIGLMQQHDVNVMQPENCRFWKIRDLK